MRYDHLTLLPDLAFQKLGKRMTYEGKSGSKPKVPDLTGAAQATADGNVEAARVAAAANRVNQITPYGNLTYTQSDTPTFDQGGYDRAYADYQKNLTAYNNQYTAPQTNQFGIAGKNNYVRSPLVAPVAPTRDQFMSKVNPDNWTATQTLSPAEQAKLDKNNALDNSLLDTAKLGLGRVNETLSKPFNCGALPANQINAGQTAQDAIFSRLDPKFKQSEESLRTRLINQGVRAGTQAWDNEFRNFNEGKNDAYIQGGLQGMDAGMRARQQALQEQSFGRNEALNTINALRSGSQVQNPNFVTPAQQATTAGADILGAQQGQYQAQVGAYNAQQAAASNTTNGLLGAAGTVGAAFFM
jgi:hypothetical protein